jgi:hypothetical protein
MVATLLLSMPLVAQEPQNDDDAEVELRRYTVEVIVFVYEENVAVGSEVFVPERIEEDADFEIEPDIDATVPSYSDDRGTRRMPPFEYVRLRRSELTMTETAGMLNRLQAYEPIMHFGWTQTTLPDMETVALPLDKLGTPPRRLHGTLQLYLSRYLHLVVDLAMDAPDAEVLLETRHSVKPLQYLINEDRIMKIEEVRYYDHPKFGVIAKVTRVETDESVVTSR